MDSGLPHQMSPTHADLIRLMIKVPPAATMICQRQLRQMARTLVFLVDGKQG
jgi:hypothetical protein